MNIFRTPLNKCSFYIALIILAATCNVCHARSSMGNVKVSEGDGLPCFSVDDNRTDNFHFFGLYVVEKKPQQWGILPTPVWKLSINPPGRWVDITAQTCFRYGVTPSFAEGIQAEPLVPYQIYDVSIKAEPQNIDDHVIAYGAEFCLKPNSDGKLIVQVIERDRTENRWNYDVCTKKLSAADVYRNVNAVGEAVASTQAVSVQIPRCSDFLLDIKNKPEHLEFVACKEVNLHGLAALVSEYQVVGSHAASVEAYFVKTAEMPKLRRACCGWESLPVNAKTQRLTGVYKVQGVAYEVSMSSGESTIGGTRVNWKKFPYFFVNVVQYLESP